MNLILAILVAISIGADFSLGSPYKTLPESQSPYFAPGELRTRQKFNSSDFKLKFSSVSPVNPLATGGTVKFLNTDNMKGLQDLSSALVTLKACSTSLPLYHPRASELFYVISAENLLAGFAEENEGRIITNKLYTADTMFIPKALIQFKVNLACTPASYIEVFSNPDPGTVVISERTFAFPDEVLESTYYLTQDQIENIKKALPATPSLGMDPYGIDECLVRCKNQAKYKSNEKKYYEPKNESKPNQSDEESNEYVPKKYGYKKYYTANNNLAASIQADSGDNELNQFKIKKYSSKKSL